MLAIAVTGSFASGKSFVLNYLKESGYKIFSCDEYIKQLYMDPKIQCEVLDIINDNNLKIFNKRKIIDIIYNDDKQRQKLENYIHPLVKEGINNFKNEYFTEKFLFTEVPLLFEVGFNNYFDYTICVYCSEENREKRARARGNFDLNIYKKIMAIQLPHEEKKALSDFQINTDLTVQNTIDQINIIINILDKI